MQLLFFLSVAIPSATRVSLSGVLIFVGAFGVLSIVPGAAGALLRTSSAAKVALFGAVSGMAVLFGLIYLPRLLIPKGSALWNSLYFG